MSNSTFDQPSYSSNSKSIQFSQPSYSKGDDIVDKKEMKRKRVKERINDFIRGQRTDYRCSKCKSVLKVVEFTYGSKTIMQVDLCKECMDQLDIASYSKGYDKGYEVSKSDV